MQSSCGPIRSKPPKRIQHPSLRRVPPQRRVSTLTSCLSTPSFFTDLHHGRFRDSGGGFGPAHIGTATGLIGENAAYSARAPARRRRSSSLEQAQNSYQRGPASPAHQSHVSPLVRLSQRKQRQCVLMGRSGYQQRSAWDLIQLRSWTGANGENASRW
jgi:hypothetical protein